MLNQLPDSFAIFRLPNQTQTYQVIGKCSSEPTSISQIKENAFLISNFNQGSEAYFIPFNQLENYEADDSFSCQFKANEYNDLGEAHYIEIVEKAIVQMKANHFQKVVLANTKNIPCLHFDPKKLLDKIQEAYPSAFIYWYSTPQTGTWIGATPEPLLTNEDSTYNTVALAGTMLKSESKKWSHKEIMEQKMVEDFIIENLNKYQISFTQNGPFDYTSGNLLHLKTEFKFNTQNKLQSAVDFLAAINPTPAVAGFPVTNALQFINKEEGFIRSCYAGFVGFKIENNLQLFVNLRCLQWQKETITLFAGAGITADSTAKLEWQETQNKMETLAKFL